MPKPASAAIRRVPLPLFIVVLVAAMWTVLSPDAALAQEGDEDALDLTLPQAIIAFVDTEGKDIPADTRLMPGSSLRVRVGIIGVPPANTQATAYLVRVKMLVERDILSKTETFAEGRLPVYSNGRQTPKYVDLPIATVEDGSQVAIAAVVMYDADGPGSAATPVQLIGSYLIQIERTVNAIAYRYAPTLKFTQGEKFFPVGVEAMLENADLKYRKTIEGVTFLEHDTLLDERPVSPKELLEPRSTVDDFDLSQTYLELNVPNGDHDAWWQGTEDQPGAESQYQEVVYARVVPVTHSDRGELISVQYWMFYVYNSATNKHEGDWEAVQLILEGDDDSILQNATDPLWLDYAAHGKVTRWANCSLGESGRPQIYVARHSHASYLMPGIYDRLFDDDALGDGDEWAFERNDYKIRLLEDQVWLDWPGRWGDWGQAEVSIVDFSLAGPQGPKFKTSEWDWDNPLEDDGFVFNNCEDGLSDGGNDPSSE